MKEMLYRTSYLRSKGLGRSCALIIDRCFSGGTCGLSIGHVSPEAAAGGAISLLHDSDTLRIDIPARTISVDICEAALHRRREAMQARGEAAWKHQEKRPRKVSRALKPTLCWPPAPTRGRA